MQILAVPCCGQEVHIMDKTISADVSRLLFEVAALLLA